jgi:hypothetical protein
MELHGSIKSLKARVNISGDAPQTVTLEVFGDFAGMHQLLKKSLKITLEEEK